MDSKTKASVINLILEQLLKNLSSRVAISGAFAQRMQESSLIELFEKEMLPTTDAKSVEQCEPFFNSFAKLIGEMINQDLTLIGRFLKV